MIDVTINWSDPVNWFILSGLAALLGMQVWLVLRNSQLSAGRKRVRLALNGLLWLVLLGYVVQPVWRESARTTHALIVGEEVPSTFSRQVQDSLGVRRRFTAGTFKGEFDSVTLLGQQFPPEVLGRLSRSAVRWLPYQQPDQVQTIQWKGIVRRGEMQRVTGRLVSSRKQALTVRYGNRTLDSLALREGTNTFTLQFPAFVQGRTEVTLLLGDAPLDTIRFFARPPVPLTYQFVLSSPDFESRTLADWLGKQGHTVRVTSTLSKDISSSLALNEGSRKTTKPDVVITDPGNAADPLVRRAVAGGQSVLFINTTDPESEARRINQAVGSSWRVRKISTESAVSVGNGLTALPYAITSTVNQFPVAGYPVAVQQGVGRIGLSLISETYPLKLSGDSVAYDRIWTAILAPLQPPGLNNVTVDAPVVAGLPTDLQVNNVPARPAALSVGRDTATLAYSAINNLSAETRYRFSRPGWHTIQDSVDVYAYDPQRIATVAGNRLLSQYVRAQTTYLAGREVAEAVTDNSVPNWVWLVLLLSCLTALWLEPKLG
ncbi:hypothetical protein DYU11_27630 [Fibrisoma montanum]|uniref:Aerotolerance regulator N-terminal domain-containing protein n=1 Tax=Fibrisoma montanum TaxID=2305895 RepID=A0A418LZY7_9BACT|nr:hypothetical protein [Fibrisoma montanum]RIV18795.1 hypothetical protein DYU11_27630 [Fibrisoma montanum]